MQAKFPAWKLYCKSGENYVAFRPENVRVSETNIALSSHHPTYLFDILVGKWSLVFHITDCNI